MAGKAKLTSEERLQRLNAYQQKYREEHRDSFNAIQKLKRELLAQKQVEEKVEKWWIDNEIEKKLDTIFSETLRNKLKNVIDCLED